MLARIQFAWKTTSKARLFKVLAVTIPAEPICADGSEKRRTTAMLNSTDTHIARWIRSVALVTSFAAAAAVVAVFVPSASLLTAAEQPDNRTATDADQPDATSPAKEALRIVEVPDFSRVPRTLLGHTNVVASVACSLGGHRLASGSWDHTVRVWDMVNGEAILTFTGHKAPVTCIAFSPDGKSLASASDDKTVKLWDATTGQEILTFTGHNTFVTSVAFSPDGKWLASASGVFGSPGQGLGCHQWTGAAHTGRAPSRHLLRGV